MKIQADHRKTCLALITSVSLPAIVDADPCLMSKKISLADWQAQLGANKSPEAVVPASAADNLVYSTTSGRINSKTEPEIVGTAYADGALRVRRETKGRSGKTVLTISGLTGSPEQLNALCSELKKKCACGGAVKDGVIEIQGDKRDQVTAVLQQKGYQVKQAGG
jgi:translation initiation factor 1